MSHHHNNFHPVAIVSEEYPKIPSNGFIRQFDRKYNEWLIRRGFVSGMRSSIQPLTKQQRAKYKLQQAIT